EGQVGSKEEVRSAPGVDLAGETDWVVVGAVSSEPVSGSNSLITEKFTGSLRLRIKSPRDCRVEMRCNSGVSHLPLSTTSKSEQGIFESGSGNCRRPNRETKFPLLQVRVPVRSSREQ